MTSLNKSRKEFLDHFAEDIVLQFAFKSMIDPEEIAKLNGLTYIYDNYGDYFDGMLVWDNENFFAHINLDRVFNRNSPRARFTLAHELCHYLVEEHRVMLKSGSHPSQFNLNEQNLIELEANYFASALLMPFNAFKKACYRKKMAFLLIDELSNTFNTSTLATILRFVVAGTYPIMVSLFENKKLKWFDRSEDFPYKVFKSKIGQPPPPTSVLGEYYLDLEKKITSIERINADDWFVTNSRQSLNEQCFYSDYGYEISIVWPD